MEEATIPGQRRPRGRPPLGVLAVLTVLLSAMTLGAAAQDTETETPAEDLAARLADVDRRVSELQGSLSSETPVEDAFSAALRRQVELLERLKLVLEDREAALSRRGALDEKRAELDDELRRGPLGLAGGPPPFSLGELDAVLDRYDALRRQRSVIEESIESQAAALERARDRRQSAERAEREALEAYENADASSAAGLHLDLRVSEIEAELAREQERLFELRLENDREDLELSRRREELFAEAAEATRRDTRPTAEQRQEALARFDSWEQVLEEEEQQARRDLERSEEQLVQVRREMERDSPARADLSHRIDSAQAALTADRQRLDLLADRRRRLSARRELWEMRYQWFRGGLDRAELRDERRRWAGLVGELEREERRRESQLHGAQASVASLELRLREGLVEAEPWLRSQLETKSGTVELLEEDLRQLGQMRLELERTLDRIDVELADFDLTQRLAELRERLAGVWNYEVLTSGTSTITLGKIVLALVLLVLGFWASRLLSARLVRRILRRFRLDEHAVAVFQTLTFYFLLLVFFFWALKLVNIPLAVFTFLGGAIAIGVGFGSQNIVNNFASGLILMAERPVKVGDLIDIDGVYGRVEKIGARSTRIRSGNNTHIIVPNSTLLESKVLNWTLSDNVVRTWVDVGVVYGSDLAAVKKYLNQALEESARVLRKPAWEILFTEFGDDALLFRAYFWTEVLQPLDQVRAQSEIRFRVDALFREAGLVIAFPQRDVHLDTARPLEVRLRRDDDSPAAS